ncbi:prolyl oligopeptidase family serine peptidase [Luteimonas sp BLCC-B24]|uniref:prolyl oligopeptidase family serine peptidase n=1 Tax=Luteimonas sp. BLCC-B24 TaxID=3025317 RepID=UPI00234D7F3A|nr:prolyl oligopeptidase family serine peptidase [Luteimonas sp. BLCC-B24]MDC7807124.1 prolyl oligopeptidase family serine peptidase [Luteimonas sp. BLCC-B24]
MIFARAFRPLLVGVLLSPLGLASAAPPPAKVQPVTDDYYGTQVTDPYRWMESGQDPDWMPWLKAQASHTQAVFAAMPGRAALLADVARRSGEMTSLGRAELAGGRVFHDVRAAGEQDVKLMVREADGRTRVLLDPTTLTGPDGDQVIDRWTASPTGRHVLVAVSKRGTELSTLRVVDVETGALLPLAIPRAWMMGWTRDGDGFSYLGMQGEPGTPSYYVGNEPRLHRLGADGEDVLLARRGEGGITARAEQFLPVAFDARSDTALAYVRDGRSEMAIYRADADEAMTGRAHWTPVAGFDDLVVETALDGDTLYLLSRSGASNGRVLRTSASAPDLKTAQALPLPATSVIESILAIDGGLLVRTLEGPASGLWRVDAGGRAVRVALPFEGQVSAEHGASDAPQALVTMTGWFTPATAYRLDLRDGGLQDLALVPPPPFDTAGYDARLGTAVARDGTRVPYTLVMKTGTQPTADTPVLLEAYGAYGYAALPRFSARMLAFLDRGGVYALANVRGGGEFGRDWHYAGKAGTKANTWRDAIDVAHHLAAAQVGSARTTTLIGTSAGGVMVGNAINERPDLFAGAIANVGFMNPVRYVSEQNYADIEEWGGPITDAASFQTMYALDPYQHIRPGTRYPPVLVVSGLNDPRAATFHSAKYAARLAAAQGGEAPVLLRLDFGAGHGMGSSRSQLDDVWTDIYAFALSQGGRAEFAMPRTR